MYSWNHRTLVGFSPRTHSYNIESGQINYRRWQHTWWNGFYTIILTKACILHRQYLKSFELLAPKTLLNYIDNHREGEDILMAYIVALLSNQPPVWVRAIVYEIGSSGISSGTSHFLDRYRRLTDV
jgi:glucuronyl/N-acetylglucosaminyl transferase EXT2